MAQTTITYPVLRVYHIVYHGGDVPKGDITAAVRPVKPGESPEAEGAESAIEVYVRGEIVDTFYYDVDLEESVGQFTSDLTGETKESLAEAKVYMKLLADAACTAGMLPS